MSEINDRQAFVTLATTDAYALGALVWARSLRRVNTTRKVVIMITTSVSSQMQNILNEVADEIVTVDPLNSNDSVNLGLLSRPDLGVTFTKLHCWRLTQYEKAVFMDADTLVLQNIDELFGREEFSASPDPGWPDCFNSGVFVFRPSLETYSRLLDFALTHGSFDGGDQGILNMFFSDWATKDITKHLPFVFNCVSQAFYSYLPAAKHFARNVKVIHFIGPVKPWHHDVNLSTGEVQPREGTGFLPAYLQTWWNIFLVDILPKLSNDLFQDAKTSNEPTVQEGVAGRLAKIELPAQVTEDLSHVGTSDSASFSGAGRERQYAWERGDIDYTGNDRFQNILDKINATIFDLNNK